MSAVKDIKDYLPLYFRVWGEVYDSKNEVYGNGNWALSARLLHAVMMDECKFKPFLRPLSDMTQKEALGIAALTVYPMRVLEILTITNDGVEFKYESFEQDRKMYWFRDELSPDMFRLLLKAGFDMFGLIEAGLAFEKTTKKN